ncbi:hypothetical protein DXG01_015874 [Tephrocybe rancida]|nr:hypothetical protein DXG01_015874 [Tephrocybe rancida]
MHVPEGEVRITRPQSVDDVRLTAVEDVSAPQNSPCLLPAELSVSLGEASVVVEEASTLPVAPSISQTPVSKKRPHGDKTSSSSASPQPSGSKSKHPRQIAPLHNQFLDLEAEEDYRDEEDILLDEDNDLDNFLTDEVFWDDEDTAGPRQISRQLAASTISDLEWEGLLEHTEQRARRDTSPGVYKQDDSEDDDSEEDDNDQRHLERMGLAKLWRVAVKEGYEETAPIVLFNKILKAGWTSVTSVFRRVSCPGWIFIEADSISKAQKVCQDISDVYVRQLYFIPPEQAGQYLLEPPPQVALFASTRHPFTMATLPMSSTTIIEEKTTRARIVRGSCVDRQKRRWQRPAQQVLPLVEGRRISDNNITARPPVSHSWKNIWFEHGFLSLDSHNIEPTVTTHKELEFFRHVDIIPTQALAAAEDEIAKLLLWEGDLVMVHWGEMRGGVGRITRVDVDVNKALVYFESSNIETFIHTSDLCKSIKLGDHVSVVGGNDDGRVGWCRPDLSQASLIDLDKIPDHCREAVEVMEKLREDNCKKYMNRRVRIVGKHPYKDYEGIMREILYDDKVKVEIAVTLK